MFLSNYITNDFKKADCVFISDTQLKELWLKMTSWRLFAHIHFNTSLNKTKNSWSFCLVQKCPLVSSLDFLSKNLLF